MKSINWTNSLSVLVLIFALIFSLQACGQKDTADVTPASTQAPLEIVDPRVEYYAGVTAHQILMREAFFELSSLIQYPMPGDGQWMFRLNVGITRIQRILRDEYGAICPIEYDEANILYMQALESFRYFTDNYPQALDNLDTTLMEACQAELRSGVELLDLTVDKLQR